MLKNLSVYFKFIIYRPKKIKKSFQFIIVHGQIKPVRFYLQVNGWQQKYGNVRLNNRC